MKKIAITNKADARKLNVALGTIIDYNDAPEHLQKRYDAIHGSTVSEECADRCADACITALKIRESVARANGTHASAYGKKQEIVLGMINATGKNLLPA